MIIHAAYSSLILYLGEFSDQYSIFKIQQLHILSTCESDEGSDIYSYQRPYTKQKTDMVIL